MKYYFFGRGGGIDARTDLWQGLQQFLRGHIFLCSDIESFLWVFTFWKSINSIKSSAHFYKKNNTFYHKNENIFLKLIMSHSKIKMFTQKWKFFTQKWQCLTQKWLLFETENQVMTIISDCFFFLLLRPLQPLQRGRGCSCNLCNPFSGVPGGGCRKLKGPKLPHEAFTSDQNHFSCLFI